MVNPLHKLDREMRKWSDIQEMLASEDLDEQELLTAIEGETDLLECLSELDESLLEDEIQWAGLDAVLARLDARMARHKKTIESKRRVIMRAMERAGLKTFKSKVGTLTLGMTTPKLVVIESAMIPNKWWKEAEPPLDKTAVTKALKAGESIPGTMLSNGEPKLTIRRQ